MALQKRSGVWWIDIYHLGRRIRRSTGTQVKADAQRVHDEFKARLWRAKHLAVKEKRSWSEAVVRWLSESTHKRSIISIKAHLRWMAPFVKGKNLDDFTRDFIEFIALEKEKTGVTLTTVNRMLEVIRAILRKAHQEWEWTDSVPVVRLRVVDTRRIRWLNQLEVKRLISELPNHLAEMALFTLATGLRESNVTGLQWSNVDLERKHAWVHPDQSKTKTAIAVPLNQNAMQILQRQIGKHPESVFSYRGLSIKRCNTRAWRTALIRADINNFRWHDLRHTWASWHVQSGTSLQELQLLGGWSNFEMVLRYAHLSSGHLLQAAERIVDTKQSQPVLRVIQGGR